MTVEDIYKRLAAGESDKDIAEELQGDARHVYKTVRRLHG